MYILKFLPKLENCLDGRMVFKKIFQKKFLPLKKKVEICGIIYSVVEKNYKCFSPKTTKILYAS
jgi:hypothetical protein